MKEFDGQTGGRYTYVDDILNLQELSLAFSEIFNGCDNFIISGCSVSDDAISEGYVYINGKIRRFAGASNVSAWPYYVYEDNKVESVLYSSGTSKAGRNIFGCKGATSVPSSVDSITGMAPEYLAIGISGGRTIKDAFFGKYALLINPAGGVQNVMGTVNFNNVNVQNELSVNSSLSLKSGANNCDMYYSGNAVVFQSKGSGGSTYKFCIDNDLGFRFYINDTLKFDLTSQAINCSLPVYSNKAVFGGTVFKPGHIFNSSSGSNSGELNINMLGYSEGTNYYRTTKIGNGKGTAILSVVGEERPHVDIHGSLTVEDPNSVAISLKSTFTKISSSFAKYVQWVDKNDSKIAFVGYHTTGSQIFSIENKVSDVVISGWNYVDLGPLIKENGVALSSKYVLKSTYDAAIAKKADLDGVYTTKTADEKFASKQSGLAQFVTSVNTKQELRKQIGAFGDTDISRFAQNSLHLSDMAKTEEDKKQIRDNIGAASAGDFQTRLKDTGWIKLVDELYIRQIGNIVSIQGILQTIHRGTVFTIPSSVSVPIHSVEHTISFGNEHNWTVKIVENTNSCVVDFCAGSCNKWTEFSLTYMV